MANKFDIDISPESPELLAIAEKELRETPEIRAKGLAELRELLKKNSDLNFTDDENFLVIILRVCHWYPESAIETLRDIAEFRKDYWKVLKDLMPEQEKTAFIEGGLINILTHKDHKNRRIVIYKCGSDWDPSVISEDSIFRMFYLLHILAQLEKSTQICGCIVIYDFEGLGMKQVMNITPSGTKRLLTFTQKAMPLRLKEVHIVKQPLIFKMVYALMKPLLDQKMKSRLHFHGDDMSKLHQFVPPNYLPKNYGGTLPEIDYSAKDWYFCAEKYHDFFLQYKDFGFKQ
ncbi:hypothetical protein PVAND_003909 [Polypedilum vanderplanki]|uniref:CRAL-TRIO domain-containing protein n=1 Tax=Polypedilum vanderplanki TaxID=319348 RepID=A0A9J6BVJ1_POLVA|nr:hypothetical protein PVAND_003909 [Polypedilum vanderplanki]